MPRSMTPRSAVSPQGSMASLHGGASAFSPFGYGDRYSASTPISESY